MAGSGAFMLATSVVTTNNHGTFSNNSSSDRSTSTMLSSLVMEAATQSVQAQPSPLGEMSAVLVTGAVSAVLMSAFFVIKRESNRRLNESVKKVDEKPKTVDRSKFPGGRITVYYATQTGTAESFAQQLEREGADHGFCMEVVDFEEVNVDGLMERSAFGDENGPKEARAIILASTYGEGEPTDNSNEIVQECKDLIGDEADGVDPAAAETLNGLDFCVFGLGNRQYEHFNAMGKFFDKALGNLGGNRILPLGVGDDDADLELDFENWKEQMWASLKDKYCKEAVLPTRDESDGSKLPDCEYAVEYHASPSTPDRSPEQVHGSSKIYFNSEDCPVGVVRELRSPEDGGSTKHVEIDISGASFDYTTADNLGVLAVNEAATVESVAKALGYDLDAVFSLKAAEGHTWHGAPFPMPLTVRECLTRYLDLTSAPRRSDLKLLTQYATDSLDRQALLRLSSKEGKQEYKEKITEGFVGIADLLNLCPSLTIPLEHFVSICHFMVPRYYTIASSSSVHPTSVHLTVAVTEDQKKDGTVFKGLCSNHLGGLASGSDTVRVFNRPSTFRLPSDPSRPIIMIGPGTGVAPMRALLQERQHQKQSGKAVGPNVLYFGCKKRSSDYLYQDEMEAWKKEGVLDELHLAFSRETPNKKVYVQHLLLENAKATCELVQEQGASIYVCGGVKMGHDVTEALKEILVSEGAMSFDQAKDTLAKLASQGRFVQELWA